MMSHSIFRGIFEAVSSIFQRASVQDYSRTGVGVGGAVRGGVGGRQSYTIALGAGLSASTVGSAGAAPASKTRLEFIFYGLCG